MAMRSGFAPIAINWRTHSSTQARPIRCGLRLCPTPAAAPRTARHIACVPSDADDGAILRRVTTRAGQRLQHRVALHLIVIYADDRLAAKRWRNRPSGVLVEQLVADLPPRRRECRCPRPSWAWSICAGYVAARGFVQAWSCPTCRRPRRDAALPECQCRRLRRACRFPSVE